MLEATKIAFASRNAGNISPNSLAAINPLQKLELFHIWYQDINLRNIPTKDDFDTIHKVNILGLQIPTKSSFYENQAGTELGQSQKS